VGYLVRELELLTEVRVIVALGQFAWDVLARHFSLRPKPRFGHLAQANAADVVVLGSYHPSQQNTFTGTLTQPMFDAVFARARALGA
jgi:uracil-DNA glycosylase